MHSPLNYNIKKIPIQTSQWPVADLGGRDALIQAPTDFSPYPRRLRRGRRPVKNEFAKFAIV